jgi:hypothetical protein
MQDAHNDHVVAFDLIKDPFRRRTVSVHAMSQGGIGPQALKHITPWSTGVPIALEFRKRIIKDSFFGDAGSRSSNNVLLLQLTEPAQDLISLLNSQLW